MGRSRGSQTLKNKRMMVKRDYKDHGFGTQCLLQLKLTKLGCQGPTHTQSTPHLRLPRKSLHVSVITPKVFPTAGTSAASGRPITHQEGTKLLLSCQLAQTLDEGQLTSVEKNDRNKFQFIQHNCVTSMFLKVLVNNSLR